MSSILFGYYGLGLKALNAAQTGLSVAGDNIANVNTPGYSRRRLELRSGLPLRIGNDYIDAGVDVAGIRRAEDRFLQASLEREHGGLGRHEEKLRGLNQLESTFGSLEGEGILSAFNRFSSSFRDLAAEPEDQALRRSAVASADLLAKQISTTYDRLQQQRVSEDRRIESTLQEVNSLASQLEDLNVAIKTVESGGQVASNQRDQRDQVVERLAELTGGNAAVAENGAVSFSFVGGPTLVTSERAVPLTITRDADGLARISSQGDDITDQIRGGRLGAQVELRDESIQTRLSDLDKLARRVTTGSRPITTGATDLNGNFGLALFDPHPAPLTGTAGQIAVNSAILADPRLLAISNDGSPGDGSGASAIAEIQTASAVILGKKTADEFMADLLVGIGNEIAEADVGASVADGLVVELQARKQAVSGVSLDQEAIELIRHQRAYEAAARFIQVLNDVTEIAVNLG